VDRVILEPAEAVELEGRAAADRRAVRGCGKRDPHLLISAEGAIVRHHDTAFWVLPTAGGDLSSHVSYRVVLQQPGHPVNTVGLLVDVGEAGGS